MLPTPLILTILTIKLGLVIADLHKPEFPRVGLPTQALSELGSVFTDQDDAYATNAVVSHIPGAKNARIPRTDRDLFRFLKPKRSL